MHLLKLLPAKDFNKANHTYPELVFFKIRFFNHQILFICIKMVVGDPGPGERPITLYDHLNSKCRPACVAFIPHLDLP